MQVDKKLSPFVVQGSILVGGKGADCHRCKSFRLGVTNVCPRATADLRHGDRDTRDRARARADEMKAIRALADWQGKEKVQEAGCSTTRTPKLNVQKVELVKPGEVISCLADSGQSVCRLFPAAVVHLC
jgi:hypothetical protein